MNRGTSLSVTNSPGPVLTDRQDTVLSTLPASTAATGEANHGGIALDLAYTAKHTCLIGFEGTFSDFSRRPLWLGTRSIH